MLFWKIFLQYNENHLTIQRLLHISVHSSFMCSSQDWWSIKMSNRWRTHTSWFVHGMEKRLARDPTPQMNHGITLHEEIHPGSASWWFCTCMWVLISRRFQVASYDRKSPNGCLLEQLGSRVVGNLRKNQNMTEETWGGWQKCSQSWLWGWRERWLEEDKIVDLTSVPLTSYK